MEKEKKRTGVVKILFQIANNRCIIFSLSLPSLNRSPLEIHFVHQSDSGALAVLAVLTEINEARPRESVLDPLWTFFQFIEKVLFCNN